MKEQWKKYTQKINAGLLAVAGLVITNPELANFIPGEYWRWIAAGAIVIVSIAGGVKQKGVTRGS